MITVRPIETDDRFTHPDLRGTGAGTALIQRLQQIAKERGASVVRWITANDNFVAQQIYERLAQRTMWVTYDLAVD
jgi:GNAT superfamily N-acetyltransferase